MMANDLARPDRSKKMRGEGQGKRLHSSRLRELVNHRGCQERNPASTESRKSSSMLCRPAPGSFPNEINN